MLPGLYLTHKPVGMTSFQVMKPLQDALPQVEGKKRLAMCHGGTLDPFAHGLLLILVGQATRLFERLHVLPKTYRAVISWGRETDTGDAGGKTVCTGNPAPLSVETLTSALQPFFGWTDQVPPATSAKKIGGEAAYKKAHRGETFELPPSRVYLHSARWLEHELPHRSTLELVVRGGFYVRSLARDLGRSVGTGAHVVELHRSSIGPWLDPGSSGQVAVHGANIVPWLARRPLTAAEADEVRAWRPVPESSLVEPSWPLPEGFVDEGPRVAALYKSKLLALLEPEAGQLTPQLNLWGGL